MKDSRILGQPEYEDLVCPLCGRSLLAVPLGNMFTLHCKSGHEIKLPDLFSAQNQRLRHGLEMLLTDWEQQHGKLDRIASDARHHGYLEVAAIVQRQMRSLSARIDLLRQCLPKGTDSSRMFAAPGAESATAG